MPAPKNRLKVYARRLRKNMTDAERIIWSRLRRKQLKEYQFYRQKIIGEYIVDFYCPRAKMVIEVDGGQHYTDEGIKKDEKRTRYLERLGLRIIRFSDCEVLKNLEGVVGEIFDSLENPPIPPLEKGDQGGFSPPLEKGDQGGFSPPLEKGDQGGFSTNGGRLTVVCFTVGPIETNMYLISKGQRPRGSEGIVIDPGFMPGEAEKIIAAIKKDCDQIPAIILTHGHFDHIAGAAILKNEFNSKIYCHELEKEKLLDPEKSGAQYFGFQIDAVNPDVLLNGGEELTLAGLKLKIIHTAGHSQGSISILIQGEHLFCGDTVFKDSIGRTDLADGDYDAEIRSITEKIMKLPADTAIHPGHGPRTTVKQEKKYFTGE